MKITNKSMRGTAGFTLVEIMASMTIGVLCIALTMSTFLFCMRAMYKDNQRLVTNASLRTFVSQISTETLNASYFYLFPYYTKLDGSVDLAADPVSLTLDDAAVDAYDRWIAHGDCLVLVTKTSEFRTTDIRQIRIYYRLTTNQTTTNNESPIRYYETADWGEGTSATSNSHPLSGLATELNGINLNSTPLITGSREMAARTKGRAVPSPYTGYTAGDRYPVFSTESPTANNTNGFVSINVEFINGTTNSNMLSSSSFNYTISPRR